uniref:Uncharacterized protein n=1 Tax=Oryza glumipatula TaxID=40148 RepID=A0A0D9Y4B5_9ORYZ
MPMRMMVRTRVAPEAEFEEGETTAGSCFAPAHAPVARDEVRLAHRFAVEGMDPPAALSEGLQTLRVEYQQQKRQLVQRVAKYLSSILVFIPDAHAICYKNTIAIDARGHRVATARWACTTIGDDPDQGGVGVSVGAKDLATAPAIRLDAVPRLANPDVEADPLAADDCDDEASPDPYADASSRHVHHLRASEDNFLQPSYRRRSHWLAQRPALGDERQPVRASHGGGLDPRSPSLDAHGRIHRLLGTRRRRRDVASFAAAPLSAVLAAAAAAPPPIRWSLVSGARSGRLQRRWGRRSEVDRAPHEKLSLIAALRASPSLVSALPASSVPLAISRQSGSSTGTARSGRTRAAAETRDLAPWTTDPTARTDTVALVKATASRRRNSATAIPAPWFPRNGESVGAAGLLVGRRRPHPPRAAGRGICPMLVSVLHCSPGGFVEEGGGEGIVVVVDWWMVRAKQCLAFISSGSLALRREEERNRGRAPEREAFLPGSKQMALLLRLGVHTDAILDI